MKMHKNVGVNTLVMLISLIIVVSAIVLLWPMIFSNTVKVTVGQGTFDAKLAIDSTSRDNGLSGVKLVDYNQALLKVYPSVGKWSVSMKDMKTSIDILWIDYAKEVVFYEKNADVPTTSSYRVYSTPSRAKYILELAPGTISARSIKIGDKVDFNIDESKVE